MLTGKIFRGGVYAETHDYVEICFTILLFQK
jgi:hypothetical protein